MTNFDNVALIAGFFTGISFPDTENINRYKLYIPR